MMRPSKMVRYLQNLYGCSGCLSFLKIKYLLCLCTKNDAKSALKSWPNQNIKLKKREGRKTMWFFAHKVYEKGSKIDVGISVKVDQFGKGKIRQA